MTVPLDTVNDIRSMDAAGRSRSEIDRVLHVSRNTVAKYADMEAPAGGRGGQTAPVELPENPLALLLRIHQTSSWAQIGSEVPAFSNYQWETKSLAIS